MRRYNPKDIEPKWQGIWDETGVYTTNLNSSKPKYVAMSMFNYPSGAGIHIGHAMNYTISDVKARFKRQQGFESYHPVGWDAFGLPAENYAIKAGVSPQESMAKIIPDYHKQYKAMGWSNDWEKEIATHLPEYYKWTQWIFSQMHKNGLAYQDSRMQWWCELDNSVLANEQVIDGKCWRHDGPDDPLVQKKEVKQWFFKITDYANELLEAIDGLDWTESVKLAQKSWIGRSDGAEVTFHIAPDKIDPKPNFVILHGFTGRNDKNFIPTLKHDLEAAGYDVQAPQLPNTDTPSETEQVNYVLEHCTFNENTILIGHSLGGTVAMKVLEKLDHAIRTLVLVAPACPPAFAKDGKRYFHSTFDFEFDYDAIVQKTQNRVILADTLEAERRQEYLEFLAPKIQAELTVTTANERHFTDTNEPRVTDAVLPSVTVFTVAHDTMYGTTFIVLAPEHDLVQKITTNEQKKVVEAYVQETEQKSEVERQAEKTKSGVFTGAYAINPLSGQEIPIWIADYVLAGYGTGAVMGVPGEDGRDFEFAKKFGLDVIYTTDQQEFLEYHETIKRNPSKYKLANSEEFNGLDFEVGRLKILEKLEKLGVGRAVVNYRMRDWSVSRQRYWGAPIPIINCPKCGQVLISDENLPVVLPELEDFQPSGDGRSALARAKDWLQTTCPQCGGAAERETDTLDTYICSSWYMYRYMDPHNQEQIFDSELVKHWEPVDFYNGADHATAHLLYARFIGHFFKKLGLVNEAEPFKQFLFNGKVTAADGKMFSKSKGNGIDPLEIIEQGYGADALRMYLMFSAPLEIWSRWDPQGVPGAHRFLSRVWNLVQEYLESKEQPITDEQQKELRRVTHQMIRKMTDDIEESRYNTAIAAAMGTTNELYRLKTQYLGKNDAWQEALEAIVACIAPFAPHTAEELWFQLGHSTTVHKDTWPKWEEKYLQQDTITVAVQINGKLRGEIQVAADISEADAIAAASSNEKVKVHTAGKEIIKTIYVPGKIVNLVVK